MVVPSRSQKNDLQKLKEEPGVKEESRSISPPIGKPHQGLRFNPSQISSQ
jgi:hypothetical protein